MNKLIALLSVLIIVSACGGGGIEKMTEVKYKGEDLNGMAEIVRDKSTKKVVLKIEENVEWELYAGETVEQIDLKSPVAKGKRGGEFKVEVPESRTRYYFLLVTSKGATILAERQLPMEGGYNFRDLGGFRTEDGRYVKWGKLFRSDDLHNLTPEDLDYLNSIPLKSIVDFRTNGEISAAPDRLAKSVENIYGYAISPGDMSKAMFQRMNEQEFGEEMEEMNRRMVSEEEIVEQYEKFFGLLTEGKKENIPLMFHCSAGKDRTGLAAALILSGLGVDRDVIIEDYLSSNSYLDGKYDSLIEENPAARPLMIVQERYLIAAFDRIEQEYGSVENYLSKELGVDLEAMREQYLY